ncbi:MAG: hypothetical protein ISS19_09625 [Bacteroidales bacterium]|nr:hypothetical protein [Bacteroidales bacterium]
MTTNYIKPEILEKGEKTIVNPNGNDVLQSHFQVKKVKLDDYGYTEAGRHMGNAKALENFLNEIKEGHVVDVNHSQKEVLKKQQLLQDAVEAKTNEMIDSNGKIESLQTVVIPAKETEISEKKEEIKKLELEKRAGKGESQYNPLMLWVFGILSLLLGIYLILFYASAIHSVFFRNLLQDLTQYGTSQNVSMMLNSIFDPSALFRWQSSLIFIYFGSTLFFALGLIAHHFIAKPWQAWKKGIAVFMGLAIPFLADFLLAFKIHENIVEAKALMGIEATNEWYESMNFWLVIVFGYIAYMAWGYIFHLFHEEQEKRNPANASNFLIQNLKKEIKSLKEQIRQHAIEITELKTMIDRLNLELDYLKTQLGNALKDPDLLLHNLHQFYNGWLRYLNAGNLEAKQLESDTLFKQFRDQNFRTIRN